MGSSNTDDNVRMDAVVEADLPGLLNKAMKFDDQIF